MSSAVLVIVLVAIAVGAPCAFAAFAYVDHLDPDAAPLESHRSEGP